MLLVHEAVSGILAIKIDISFRAAGYEYQSALPFHSVRWRENYRRQKGWMQAELES
jgi:hypothetical protein